PGGSPSRDGSLSDGSGPGGSVEGDSPTDVLTQGSSAENGSAEVGARSRGPALGGVARLALPAFVVLAAEPVYILVDTAVVGHLGRTELAALALGGAMMSLIGFLGTVLAYG